MTPLFQLARALTAPSTGDLADLLARLHDVRMRAAGPDNGRSSPPTVPKASHASLAISRSPLASIDPGRLAELFVAIDDARSRIQADGSKSYGDLWQRLRGFEAALREQASMVDAMMSKVVVRGAAVPAPVPALQQIISVQCPRGGRSGGRFRCLNRFVEAVEVSVDGGAARVASGSGGAVGGATTAAEPSRFSLAPGADTIVRLALDLREADTGGLDAVTAVFDVRLNGRPHARVWLEAELYDDR